MSQLGPLSGELVLLLEFNQELLPQSLGSTEPSLSSLIPNHVLALVYNPWEPCLLDLIVLFLSSGLLPCCWGLR